MIREDAFGVPLEVKLTDFGISNHSGVESTSSGSGRPARSSSKELLRSLSPSPGAFDANDDTRDIPQVDGDVPVETHVLFDRASGAGSQRVSSAPAFPSRTVPECGAASLTRTGTLLGTPRYMAPETFGLAKERFTASDIYSLGVLAFELLHGRPAMSEADAMAYAYGYFEGKVPSFFGLGLPEELAIKLNASLAREPRERPTANDLAVALEHAARVTARAETTVPQP